MPALPRDWLVDEPGLAWIGQELARLLRRAASRPVLTIGLALLCAMGVTYKRSRKVRFFASRVVFRVTESDLDVSTAPRPAKYLRSYVGQVAFSSPRLLGLIRERGLYPRDIARDPMLAVESMRDDVAIDVWRNYFLEVGDPGRSAHIGLTYQSDDPDRSYEVVGALGRLLIETQQTGRLESARASADFAAMAREQASTDLYQRRSELVSRVLEARKRATPALAMEIAGLRHSLEALEVQLQKRDSDKEALDMRVVMERKQMGMMFEMVDPGRPAPPLPSRPRELLAVALITLLAVLPLCGIAVGAFDSRIRGIEDVRRLGLSAIGHVPDFPGIHRGTLEERWRTHRVE
ncbi:MAG: hypothetical protein EXR72_21030 [Myxococcales bacterium]|nr:hypothetical protein [Myxococcales bacterium]